MNRTGTAGRRPASGAVATVVASLLAATRRVRADGGSTGGTDGGNTGGTDGDAGAGDGSATGDGSPAGGDGWGGAGGGADSGGAGGGGAGGGSAAGGSGGGAAGGGGLVGGLTTGKVAAVVVAGAVVVGAGAGAVYFYRQQQQPNLSGVPEGVDAVAYLNVDRATSDEAIEAVVNKVLSLSDSETDDFQELLSDWEDRTDLELDKLHTVVSYAKYVEPTGDGRAEYRAAILRSDWSADAFVEAYESTSVDYELVEDEYEGVTVYRPDGDVRHFGTTSWIGVLGDGRFVVGTPAAVKDAIDVETGEQDPIEGELKRAFRNERSGYLKFAAKVPSSQIPDRGVPFGGGVVSTGPFTEVEIVTGAYYTGRNEMGVQFTLRADEKEVAEDVKQVVDGAVSLAGGTVENAKLESTLDQVTVTRKGTDVVVSFENEVEDIKQLLEALKEEAEESDGTTLMATRAADQMSRVGV